MRPHGCSYITGPGSKTSHICVSNHWGVVGGLSQLPTHMLPEQHGQERSPHDTVRGSAGHVRSTCAAQHGACTQGRAQGRAPNWINAFLWNIPSRPPSPLIPETASPSKGLTPSQGPDKQGHTCEDMVINISHSCLLAGLALLGTFPSPGS